MALQDSQWLGRLFNLFFNFLIKHVLKRHTHVYSLEANWPLIATIKEFVLTNLAHLQNYSLLARMNYSPLPWFELRSLDLQATVPLSLLAPNQTFVLKNIFFIFRITPTRILRDSSIAELSQHGDSNSFDTIFNASDSGNL